MAAFLLQLEPTMSEPKQVRLSLQNAEGIVARGACEIFAAMMAGGEVDEQNEGVMMQRAVRLAAQIAVESSKFISEGDDRFDDSQPMSGGISILK